jgi:formylmethanofuran dehydrogenase subunit A
MLTRFVGARVIDPAHATPDAVRDLYVRDGRIVPGPREGEPIHRTWDAAGTIAMAGAIDLHTHIGGGKVNIARGLLPELGRQYPVTATEVCGACTMGPAPWATPRASSRRCCR